MKLSGFVERKKSPHAERISSKRSFSMKFLFLLFASKCSRVSFGKRRKSILFSCLLFLHSYFRWISFFFTRFLNFPPTLVSFLPAFTLQYKSIWFYDWNIYEGARVIGVLLDFSSVTNARAVVKQPRSKGLQSPADIHSLRTCWAY